MSLALAACEAGPLGPEGRPPSVPDLARRPAEPSIRLEELPTLGGLEATPSGITEGGVVVGRAAFSVSPFLIFHAVRWQRSAGSERWEIEDLHGLLPASTSSQADAVGESGLVIGSLEIEGALHGFVLSAAGGGIDLGAGTFANAVSAFGELAGFRECRSGAGCVRLPLYWPEPGAAPRTLPTLVPGAAGEALFFLSGGGVVGTAGDEEGQWLVEWSRNGDAWSVSRIRPSPPRGPLPREVSAGGIAFGNGCESAADCDPLYDVRPFAWMTLSGPAIALPTLADLRTWVSGASPGGLAAGTAHVKGLSSYVPVLWPGPASILQLPLLPKGSAGHASHANNAGQVVGTVRVSEKGGSRVVPVVWTLP